MQSVILN